MSEGAPAPSAPSPRFRLRRKKRETWPALWELTLARVREFIREPEAVFWVFVFPVILALALGVAFRNRPPERMKVAVVSELPEAKTVLKYLSRSRDLAPVIMSSSEAMKLLHSGKLELVVEPPSKKENKPAPNKERLEGREQSGEDDEIARFAFRYDPSRPTSRLTMLAVKQALILGEAKTEPVKVEERLVSESGARYIDFLIPGLIGLNLMASGMWGVGFNVVDSRTKKLLKLLTATPLPRHWFLMSFMLSRLIFLFLEVAALLGFGWLVFDVRIYGSLLSLAAISILGAMTFAGLGLLVAARSMSIEAVSGWMNFVMLPMWLLSGSFFSYSRFPEFMIPFIRALPLTALNDALRAVINEGAALAGCASELGVLALWGLLSFTIALKIFRWE